MFLSGAFAAYVVSNAIFVFSWFCYVPLFLLLANAGKRQVFFSGLAFGLGISSVIFFWMLGAAKEFSGNHVTYSIFVTALSTVLFAFYWGGVIVVINRTLKGRFDNSFLKAALVASVFVLAESVLTFCFQQMPYYLFISGYGLLNNLYTIQFASFLGLPVLTFAVICVNYLLADAILSKRWNKLLLPVGIIVMLISGGLLIKSNIDNKILSGAPIKVAIVAENVPPQLRWDEHGGKILAQRLLSLNRQAAVWNPDIVLWSESSIPWTYREDDDLLGEILKEPYPAQTTQIIGMMGEYSKSEVYNSAYAISRDGRVIGKHDKTYLLSFIETPVFGLNMPFQDLDGYLIKNGEGTKPVSTPKGKAGIAICNEIINPEASILQVRNGAEFLLNLSNDAWFKDGAIIEVHFLYGRLSAVINRKDVALNSNNGLSGHVKANGEVLSKRKSKDMFVELATISPNNYDNSGNYHPFLVPILSLLFFLFSVCTRRISNSG